MSEVQIKALGGSIRPGEPGYPIIYWKALEGQDKPSIQSLLVYNIDQCKGIPEDKIPELTKDAEDPIKQCEALIVQAFNPPKISHAEPDTLYYDFEKDYIQIPPMQKFESPELYYKTLFSELVRSTFHASRPLKTDIEIKQFNAIPYTLEALVAEMGATYLASWAGLPGPIPQDTDEYKELWIHALKTDKYLLVKAGTIAQKVVDYLIGNMVGEGEQTDQSSPNGNDEQPKKKTARKRRSS
jgi:antirestriction protein ArdC